MFMAASAGLADEWLQARNELSIEIFLPHPLIGSSRRLPRLKASPTASSGDPSRPRPPCVAPAFVDPVQPSSSSSDATDAHGGQARLVPPRSSR